jgi:riboflavin biosynthesis pyrimidine reductase
VISGFTTISQCSPAGLVPIGSPWTLDLFDGPFYRSAAKPGRPVLNLVFVQSRDRNTVAANPSTLGGGAADAHLIYEGLSRVDADAVMAGSKTARSERLVFSVWHPELVRLRAQLGRDRHPAQIVVTARGELAIERALMFQVPELRVYIVTRSQAAQALRARVGERPWIEVIDAGDPLSLTAALSMLYTRGLHVISAVGGRTTASALIDERLVSDLYLTTSPIEGGEANTPFYSGPPLALTRVLQKAGKGNDEGVQFEYCLLNW